MDAIAGLYYVWLHTFVHIYQGNHENKKHLFKQ